MMTQELTLVFAHQTVNAAAAWGLISDCLVQNSQLERSYRLAGQETVAEELHKTLGNDVGVYFNIEGDLYEFDLTIVTAFAHDAIRISAKQDTDWDGWVDVLKSAGEFVQAYVVDVEFDYWQNAIDPLQYTAKNMPYEHLPMISNGLPPPLNRSVIDTSNNPGRRMLRSGYIEAVGSPMWLSDKFFELTGADSSRLLSDENIVVERKGDIVKIEIADRTPAKASRDPALLKLRRELFSQ